MLEEAVRLVFPEAGTACLCEWESYAASVLLARMEDQSMEPAPVWCGDLGSFDAQRFRGLVDILVAGLPCQPYSVAGKQQGNDDHRSWGEDGCGPIPAFVRIVDESRPPLVFLENVPAWIRGGWFRDVGDELCRMGYEIADPVFVSGTDIGASHQRERGFVLAYHPQAREFCRWRTFADELADAQHDGSHGSEDGEGAAAGDDRGAAGQVASVQPSRLRHAAGQMELLADATGADGRSGGGGTQAGTGTQEIGRERSSGGGSDVADAQGHGQREDERCGARSSRREDRTLFPEGNGIQPAVAADVEDANRPVAQCDSGLGTVSRAPEGAGTHGQPAGSGLRLEEDQLADAEILRLQGRRGEHTGEPLLGSDCGELVFAPSPTDPRWPDIIAANPHLAPAVESGFRMLADGMAMVVDESRADQLRCTGNGVIPLQAAVALVALLRSVNLICLKNQPTRYFRG